MNKTHIISTTDPINGFDITDMKDRPHVVEGDDTNDLTIYFETEASLQAYCNNLPGQGDNKYMRRPCNSGPVIRHGRQPKPAYPAHATVP